MNDNNIFYISFDAHLLVFVTAQGVDIIKDNHVKLKLIREGKTLYLNILN